MISIESCDIHLVELQTRLPFKYGIATMTRAPHAFVRVHLKSQEKSAFGIAADHLPPKWFTKDPAKSLESEVIEMLEVIEKACAHAQGASGPNAFQVWRGIYDRQASWARERDVPPLLAHFGTSLVERALLEAVCKLSGLTFSSALAGEFGLNPGQVHAELAGAPSRAFLPAAPLDRIVVRHTVGLADALLESDIPAGERLDDGLPQSLEASIDRYGLRHFKVKINGQLENDLQRLKTIARILLQKAPSGFVFTLDGNEQFKSMSSFRSYWESVQAERELHSFLEHLSFIEQPLHRSVALEDAVKDEFRQWAEHPRIIIDESDGEIASVPRALGLGYRGTSHKNCKGIFKGVCNRLLLNARQRAQAGSHFIMSGEDLCNVGPVALLQDLAVMASLGIDSVERNGHHYFAGLSMFPKETQEQVLEAHPDLYQRTAQGWPAMRIEDGSMSVASLNRASFGTGFVMNVEQFKPAEEFRKSMGKVKS